MSKIKTFIDANVLIAAFRGQPHISEKAFMIIDDPKREFIANDYLKLEVIPQPKYNDRQEETEFMEAFFENVSQLIRSDPGITLKALELGSQYGLGAMDALHASAAIQAQADEFITLEKNSKPLFRLNNLNVKSLLDI